MTEHEESGDGTNCRERQNHDATPRSLVPDNHGEEMYLGENEEDVGMISSKSSMRDDLDHVPCGKLRQFWALHKGLLLALLSCFAQACGSIGVKMLAGKIPPTEIASIRLLSYFVFCNISMVYFKIPLRVTKKQLPWLLLRVTCGTTAMCLLFYAYQNIPIGDTSAIIFSSPIFTGIFAWILLGERFTLVDMALALLTLVGIVLIARPSFLFGNIAEPSGDGNTLLGIIAALVGAIFASMVFVLIRKLGGISVHPLTQIWFFGLIGFTLTTVLTAVLGIWVIPRCGRDRFVLIVVGVLGFVAQILMTYAFKLEKATYVAVMKSNNVILSFLFEFAIFGTVPFWLSIIGASLVMSSSLGITVKKWKASKTKKEKEDEDIRNEDQESDNEDEN